MVQANNRHALQNQCRLEKNSDAAASCAPPPPPPQACCLLPCLMFLAKFPGCFQACIALMHDSPKLSLICTHEHDTVPCSARCCADALLWLCSGGLSLDTGLLIENVTQALRDTGKTAIVSAMGFSANMSRSMTHAAHLCGLKSDE